MAVRRVDTLGCHPLVLMKKLAAIGGLEILKEEKHTHDGVDYLYHIVAKVKDGLYVEAKDPLYEQAITPARLPQCGAPLQLECTSEMLANLTREGNVVIPSTEPLIMEAYGPSFLVVNNRDVSSKYCMVTTCSENGNAGNSGTYLFGNPVSPISGGATFFGKDNVQESAFSIASHSGTTVIYTPYGNTAEGKCKGVCVYPPSSKWNDFGIALNIEAFHDVVWKPVIFGYGSAYQVLSLGESYRCSAAVISGTVFRISSQISGDSLVIPSTWETLPCVPTIMSNQGGLFFCYNPADAHSGMIAAVTLDPSKGNGIEGSFPAIYNSGVLCGVHATGGEKLRVLGSPANPAGTITMQLFSPEVPIPVDSVSGGPVVTDLFAYNSEEIRGSVEGLLAARENLPVGSVGWLDGKRYRVHLPGRMLQIG